jgi:hypothetical protein
VEECTRGAAAAGAEGAGFARRDILRRVRNGTVMSAGRGEDSGPEVRQRHAPAVSGASLIWIRRASGHEQVICFPHPIRPHPTAPAFTATHTAPTALHPAQFIRIPHTHYPRTACRQVQTLGGEMQISEPQIRRIRFGPELGGGTGSAYRLEDDGRAGADGCHRASHGGQRRKVLR